LRGSRGRGTTAPCASGDSHSPGCRDRAGGRAGRTADDATFDGLATSAQRLTTADLQGAAWALTATCGDGDSPTQRLCKAVRDRRAATLRAGTYLVDAERGAFQVAPWDPDAQASLLELRGCVACVTPIGGLYVVASKAPPTFNGDVATAASLHQGVRSFATQAAADRWAAHRRRRPRAVHRAHRR
jgi:hypothetical protein